MVEGLVLAKFEMDKNYLSVFYYYDYTTVCASVSVCVERYVLKVEGNCSEREKTKQSST